MIREAIEAGDTQNLTSIKLAIESSGGFDYTEERARDEAHAAATALDPLPESKYKKALKHLTHFAITRRY